MLGAHTIPGHLIRDIRHALFATQREFGVLCGRVTDRTVYSWETDKHPMSRNCRRAFLQILARPWVQERLRDSGVTLPPELQCSR